MLASYSYYSYLLFYGVWVVVLYNNNHDITGYIRLAYSDSTLLQTAI